MLGSLLQGIEHIGSTAVAGLAAKPILDIDLIIDHEAVLHEVSVILVNAGYTFLGDQGIRDRYAFRALSVFAPENGSGRAWPVHHLYCCIAGSPALTNHLLLRNALRRDAALRTAYEALKKKLAVSVQGDMAAYVEGKSNFISSLLHREGMAADTIAGIIHQNKKSKEEVTSLHQILILSNSEAGQ